jgi:hypothetical protein
MDFKLDYSKMIHLDAEDLAEGGIQRAYRDLVPLLLKYVKEADEVTEDNIEAPGYSVHHRDHQYTICGPDSVAERMDGQHGGISPAADHGARQAEAASHCADIRAARPWGGSARCVRSLHLAA